MSAGRVLEMVLDNSLVDLTGDTPPSSPHKRARRCEREAVAAIGHAGEAEGAQAGDTEALSQLLGLGTGTSRATCKALLAHFSYAGPEGSVSLAAGALLDGTVASVLRDAAGGGGSARIPVARDADSGSSEALARALTREDESKMAQKDLLLAARLARQDTEKGEQASQLLASTMRQDSELLDEEVARKLQASLRSRQSRLARSEFVAELLEEAARKGGRDSHAVVCREVDFYGSQTEPDENWGCARQLGCKVKDTKTWIGPTDVAGMLRSRGVRCHLVDFVSKDQTARPREVVEWVFKHLSDGVAHRGAGVFPGISSASGAGKLTLRRTERAPLMLQHDGHSRTVVGVMRTGDLVQLLVLDPAHDAKELHRILSEKNGRKWQCAVKRGTHTFAKAAYQILVVDDDGLVCPSATNPQGG
ncbi:peptidase family C78-domain-containing protein, partial [Baffinella frigidus]